MTTIQPVSDVEVRLDLRGMTCAACAGRIQKQLNRIDGVTATVNFATEQAAVRISPGSASTVDVPTLIATVESAGYHATEHRNAAAKRQDSPAPDGTTLDESETDPELQALRQRLIGTAALGLPVVVLSMIPALQFEFWQWLCFALAAPVATWGAWSFHRAAAMNLRHGAATMDTLVSLGVIASFGASVWALFFGGAGQPGVGMSMSLWGDTGDAMAGHSGAPPHLYLEVAVSIVVLILTGRFLERRARRRAGEAVRALLEVGAKQASVLGPDGTETLVDAGLLAVGDRFVVRPGERVATDGTVVEGASGIDASAITGESVPVEVTVGDAVIGGTTNVGGRVVVTATSVGADTQLANMARLVEDAQNGTAPVQRLADRVASVFVPVVVLLAVGTLAWWWLVNDDLAAGFNAAVAVLVIACPCALGLATPTALLVGTGRGAQLGILIRGPEILESTRRVDTVVLDKTGTVTTGVMTVADTWGTVDDLAVIASVEASSEHPIGRAIAATLEPSVRRKTSDFLATAGAGVRANVEGTVVDVGRPTEALALVNAELAGWAAQRSALGETVVIGSWDGQARAGLSLSDRPKATARAAIEQLVGIGLLPVLLTGDSEATARTVGEAVGIERVVAGVLPAGKVELIRSLQAEGRVVAMVGDGVNDAPALAAADLGLAMGSGTDAAIEAADITLVRDDLKSVPEAITLSRRTLRTIKSNLFWAFAYNTAAIPLAATGRLSPVIAAAAMASSSVFVVLNSLRLRRFTP